MLAAASSGRLMCHRACSGDDHDRARYVAGSLRQCMRRLWAAARVLRQSVRVVCWLCVPYIAVRAVAAVWTVYVQEWSVWRV